MNYAKCATCHGLNSMGFCQYTACRYPAAGSGVINGSVYVAKPITNADRIRSMTDEELAMQLALPHIVSPPWCSVHNVCPYISEDPTPCDKCALDWLKQEASE